MCKTECLLVVAALSIGLVNSWGKPIMPTNRIRACLLWESVAIWDIAITTGDQLEFYSNQTKTTIEGARFRALTALAYDAVHNMLLFVDKQNDNASIFSYHIATKKYQSLVRRRSDENIQGIAFDPVKGMLFWTDTNERSIFWLSLLPGSKNNVYGNLLLKMEDEIPRAIAVDSCRGYIYWTNTNFTKPTIERARFDGSERKVIVNTDIYMPVGIAIDQKTKRLYWTDDKEGIHFSVESSDLEGKDRTTFMAGTYHQPNALTITKDSIYWIDWGFKSIWKLAKDEKDSESVKYLNFSNEVPFGIVGNYKIEDQVQGVPECEALLKMSQNKTAINDSFNIPKDVGLFCLHGVKIEGKLACKCSSGYTGERCELSLCHNYCLNGECSFTEDGAPKCRCNTGFTGTRCESEVCLNYCLNSGVCSVSDDQAPTCQCPNEFEGQRCEKTKAVPKPAPVSTVATPAAVVVTEPVKECNCTNDPRLQSPLHAILNLTDSATSTDGEFVLTECNQSWDTVRDPIIVVLGVMCGLLCVACTFLVTRVLHLKRRPRIKKRIIVNKNVTPMTARPDQCEITIENCCNMNICETPCFEPRSTIRPTLGDAKPGKEEKNNLLANMELPEDY